PGRGQTAQSPPPGFFKAPSRHPSCPRRRWAQMAQLALMLVALVSVAPAVAAGAGGFLAQGGLAVQDGGYCSQTSDCEPSLVCASGPAYDVCQEHDPDGKQSGEFCQHTYECVYGLVCASGPHDPNGKQSGDACKHNYECVYDLVCAAGPAYDVCQEHDPNGKQSAAAAGAGGFLAHGDPAGQEGDSCSQTSDCEAGLVCASGPAYDVCQEHDPNGKQSGDACEHDYECVYGLVCAAGPAYDVCQEHDPNGK
ncbi:unnamed protein product, partial [Prorocentrum cordatum]